MNEIRFRPVTLADEPVLWQMLFYAAHMEEDGATSPAAAQANPFLAQYVQGWGQPGDLGVIAETTTGQAVGAAWLRLLMEDKTSASYYDDQTPELAIALLPEWMGKGVGTTLLKELLTTARPQVSAIVLTVRANSPAVRLYQRCQFTTIGEIENRVGGKSYKMLWRNGAWQR